LEVLHSFEKTLSEDSTSDKLKKHDRNELTLYEARIYEAMSDHKKALEVLSREKLIANQTAKNEMLARIHLALGDKDNAILHLDNLLQLNSSN
jgi:tetratricopeptide (TPR) repeat protein